MYDFCSSEEVVAKCIICEKELCTNCLVKCDLQDKEVCIRTTGEDIVIYRCPATFCATCARENLIFQCKKCELVFYKTCISNEWAKPCPTCKDHLCGFCFEDYMKSCTDFFDKKKELDKLYKLIQGDKEA